MVSAAQLRAARGLLDWTRADLAKAANVSPETIKNIEHGTFRPQEATTEAITRAFAAHDVVFTEQDGVKKHHDRILRFEGVEGFKSFLDDVFHVAQSLSFLKIEDKPICISNVDDRFFSKMLHDYSIMHAQRMNSLVPQIKARILIYEKPSLHIQNSSYREYKTLPGLSGGNVPFYVYGDKLGVLVFEEGNDMQIVVISSPLVAKAYRAQFDILWDTATVYDGSTA
ncbi:MAG: helix-turn-helix transcriptional regulator [Alphaproteobacteria bacterium]